MKKYRIVIVFTVIALILCFLWFRAYRAEQSPEGGAAERIVPPEPPDGDVGYGSDPDGPIGKPSDGTLVPFDDFELPGRKKR